MPYSAAHKKDTRAKIVEAARVLFNRHGFEAVTINQIMKSIGLTRGGFYNHFDSKESLYGEAVSSFLMGRGARWRGEAGVDPHNPSPGMARRMLQSYLSSEHLADVDGQCPMIALPSDVARAGPAVQQSYQGLLESMVWLFEQCLLKEADQTRTEARQQALSLAALSIGGMVIARSLPESELAEAVRQAAFQSASGLVAQ